MEIQEFNEIIDFAVAREQEAVQFYRDLQGMARFDEVKQMLIDLQKMEEAHIITLENMRSKGLSNISGHRQISNLKISDYLIDVKPFAQMNYQDILRLAMKREEKSVALYTDMASRFSGTELEPLFNRLAAEEGNHKLHFERLYDEDILTQN